MNEVRSRVLLQANVQQSEVKAAEVMEDKETRERGPLCHRWQQSELMPWNCLAQTAASGGAIFSNTHLSKGTIHHTSG